MSIPFTQYLRPDGRKSQQYIERPPEIEKLAQEVILAGGTFIAEVLLDGTVSLTVEATLEDENGVEGREQDIAIELSPNSAVLPYAVDRLVKNAHNFLVEEVPPR